MDKCRLVWRSRRCVLQSGKQVKNIIPLDTRGLKPARVNKINDCRTHRVCGACTVAEINHAYVCWDLPRTKKQRFINNMIIVKNKEHKSILYNNVSTRVFSGEIFFLFFTHVLHFILLLFTTNNLNAPKSFNVLAWNRRKQSTPDYAFEISWKSIFPSQARRISFLSVERKWGEGWRWRERTKGETRREEKSGEDARERERERS